MWILHCSKSICISLLVLSIVTLSQENFIKDSFDDAIYKSIHGVLTVARPDQPELVKCMVDDFRGNKIADKFYSTELLTNSLKLQEEIQPYINVAEIKCKIALFIQSPLGICILIALLLLLIICCCCILRCLCC